jgi:ABC-type nitrate/sulfonate/bicarbonate transport system permease component
VRRTGDLELPGRPASGRTRLPGRLPAALRTERLLGVGLIVVLLVLWEVAVRRELISSPSVPAPSEAARALADGIASGEIGAAVLATLRKFILGYLLAAGVGVPVGILMGRSRIVHGLLEPITELVRPVPGSAYIPIAVLLLGIGDEMKVAVTAVASFFPILLNTFEGVRGCDPTLIDTGRTFRASSRQLLQKIVLPGALPAILTGMRISLSVALILVTVSEMLAGNEGVGYYIIDAQRSFRPPEMFAGIFTLAVLGYVINYLFVAAANRALRWRAAGVD